ncbi:hypothetical protein EMIT047CA2_80117 [Pseudomonas soli]
MLHRRNDFLTFLREIDASVPAKMPFHLIMANYATYKTEKVKAWFTARPRYNIHFTPTSASWQNLVECFFVNVERKKYQATGTCKHQSFGSFDLSTPWEKFEAVSVTQDRRRYSRLSRSYSTSAGGIILNKPTRALELKYDFIQTMAFMLQRAMAIY